jgi:6-phosphogluconolactonase
MNIIKFNDSTLWVNEIVNKIIEYANKSIIDNGIFNIVLVGGHTPITVYNKLVEKNTNWENWHFWIGDERFPDNYNTELNKDIIFNNLISKLFINPNQIHFMNVTLGLINSPLLYNEELKNVNTFDLTLLGIGEDGHTASLFPGNYLGNEINAPNVFTVTTAQKLPKQRITLSARRLSKSKNILFLAKGVYKLKIISEIESGLNFPCTTITAFNNTDLYFCTS